jgi:hypothetical protein
VTGAAGAAAPAAFPFFVGSGRSGTTLLRAMFDAHPDVAVPDEVSFIVRLDRPHNAVRYRRPGRIDVDALLHLLQTNSSFRRWGLPAETVRAALADPPVATFPEAVRRLYATYAAERGKHRWADKTPMHVQYLRRLARLFPEARFVHLIRDGRDVACSYLDAPFGPRSVEEAAFEWRRRVLRGRSQGAPLGQRYREVRYETLVARPEEVLRSLCGELDVPFDERMLRYHVDAADLIGSTVHPGSHQRLLLPPTPGLRDWRQELSPEDLATFEAIAGDALDTLGYERGGPAPGSRDRLVASGRRATQEAARLTHIASTNARAAARQLVHGRGS